MYQRVIAKLDKDFFWKILNFSKTAEKTLRTWVGGFAMELSGYVERPTCQNLISEDGIKML